MMMAPYLFFSDPVFAAPMIGTMLMGMASALVGVFLFVRKQSLMGEALAHSAYPGVAFAVYLAAIFSSGEGLAVWVLVGAFLSCLLAFFLIEKMISLLRISSDATLCFTLAIFFGAGITVASFIQFSHPKEFRQVQAYLYGQAATMSETHILIYALLCLIVVCSIALFYKEIQMILFDSEYARSTGAPFVSVLLLIHFLVVLAIVIGIRCVGVILMSAMLIGPAVAARCFTAKLPKMFLLSALFGMGSALLGNMASVYLSDAFLHANHHALPTGPMIVLCIGALALFSLLFAPRQGFAIRFCRIAFFRLERVCENILKKLWQHKEGLSLAEIEKTLGFSRTYLQLLLYLLRIRKLIHKPSNNLFLLTDKGEKKGGRIIRLHRIWELYLVEHLGTPAQKVHKNAEEMEHILTAQLEEQLTMLLNDPKLDPHHQPIPAREG